MRPKIVIISGFYPRIKGGAEYQMRIIADALKDYFEIIFVYIGDAPSYSVEKTKIERVDGYKVYSVKTSGNIDRVFGRYFLSRRIKDILIKEKPEIVYQRVFKLMSYYFASFQKSLGYHLFIHISDLYSIDFTSKGLNKIIKRFLFNQICKTDADFISQTEEQNNILLGLGKKTILQMYNLHPAPRLNVENCIKQKSNLKVRNIIWIANVKPIKQLELFIEIAEFFEDDITKSFYVIGDVQDPIYFAPILSRMKKMANLTHYTDKDNDFVNKFLLEDGDLVINTSKSEGFSNVFIQAWMRGVPVFSLNSNPDSLFDRYSVLGQCFYGDLTKLKENLNMLWETDNNEKLSIERHSLALSLFEVDSNIRELQTKLYKSLKR